MVKMQYYLVATSVHANQHHSAFTYHSQNIVSIGQVVLVSVGKKEVVGIVIGTATKPIFTTKPIIKNLQAAPLPRPLLELAEWLSVYYQAHPANVWQTLLPRGLQKKRQAKERTVDHPKRKRTTIVLNNDQIAAVHTITTMNTGTALLEGITGSGKTQVYIESAKHTLGQGKSVIILVPEIALTSQLVAEFSNSFPDIILTHSTMGEAARQRAWETCLMASKPLLVVGPRSALFSPLKDLGLIIIDECHEPSFKQEQAPRYSALRTARMLASYHGARLVLGSATPTVVDRYLAEQSHSPILRLTKSARPHTQPPSIEVIDMTKKPHFTRHRFFSNTLLQTINASLSTGEQSLIFHNRRGSAPTTLCENCGWSAACARCFVPLTLHDDSFELRCHVCNHLERVPTACPTCHQANIIHKGIGTKLIETELRKLFPKATINRFDGDSTSEQTVEKLYQQLYDGSIDIIIGTQVIAKGLDLPKLRTVGIIQADSGLSLPDFQASERVFQLVSQVRGRIGRSEHASKFIIQSYQPTHPSIAYGIKQDYETFYHQTLAERQRALFPPFTHLLKLTCVYKTEAGAVKACQALARELRLKKHPAVTILGPAPSFYERIRDTYRWQLTLKSPKREHLIQLLAHVPATKWQTELDPMSLL